MIMLRHLCLFVVRLIDTHNAVSFFVRHYGNPTSMDIRTYNRAKNTSQ